MKFRPLSCLLSAAVLALLPIVPEALAKPPNLVLIYADGSGNFGGRRPDPALLSDGAKDVSRRERSALWAYPTIERARRVQVCKRQADSG